MRIVVCIKHVPVLSALKFDPATRRLVREKVPGEPSAFDVRALLAATALRAAHGGEVVALTMGPPAARDALVERALALGGSCSGEHGMGLGNRRYAAREHGAALELMAGVKALFDPHGILNPGKMW